MSLLPQRKKSAEEIAKLRETLGIPGQSPAEELPAEPEAITPRVQEPVISRAEKIPEPPATSPLAPIPAPELKEVRSLRRSERMPVLPVDDSEPVPYEAAVPPKMPASSPLPVAPGLRPVRSLRKSEQAPADPHHRTQPAPDSSLPTYRHSDRELNEIRRREALTALAQEIRPPSLSAHPSVILAGYLSAIAAGIHFHFYDLERQWMLLTAGGVLVSLYCAGFIFFRKPLSRHHAAFIAVAALFVIVFGALHYFPTLRHGT